MSQTLQLIAFEQNVEIDALLVTAGMNSGLNGVLTVALSIGIVSPDEAIQRAKWLKTQPKEYIDKVVALIISREPK